MITATRAGEMSKHPDIWKDWRGIVAVSVYMVLGQEDCGVSHSYRLWFVGWDCEQP